MRHGVPGPTPSVAKIYSFFVLSSQSAKAGDSKRPARPSGSLTGVELNLRINRLSERSARCFETQFDTSHIHFAEQQRSCRTDRRSAFAW
jgi:hypothetical protein